MTEPRKSFAERNFGAADLGMNDELGGWCWATSSQWAINRTASCRRSPR